MKRAAPFYGYGRRHFVGLSNARATGLEVNAVGHAVGRPDGPPAPAARISGHKVFKQDEPATTDTSGLGHGASARIMASLAARPSIISPVSVEKARTAFLQGRQSSRCPGGKEIRVDHGISQRRYNIASPHATCVVDIACGPSCCACRPTMSNGVSPMRAAGPSGIGQGWSTSSTDIGQREFPVPAVSILFRSGANVCRPGRNAVATTYVRFDGLGAVKSRAASGCSPERPNNLHFVGCFMPWGRASGKVLRFQII